MKTTITLNVLLILSTFWMTSCKSSHSGSQSKQAEPETIQISADQNEQSITIEAIKGKSFNHPTFVIWLENLDGDIIKTIYVTKSYANGTFGHAQLSDSTWSDKPGESIQPAALPYWNHKKGMINGKNLVPTPENPYVDAYSSATPENNFIIKGSLPKEVNKLRVFIEVNQTWDWNQYWTNGKIPGNRYYKNSAQPSLIYSVLVSKIEDGKTYHLNPIGHGHPSGDNGDLFTDLSTLTTAKQIFSSLTVKF